MGIYLFFETASRETGYVWGFFFFFKYILALFNCSNEYSNTDTSTDTLTVSPCIKLWTGGDQKYFPRFSFVCFPDFFCDNQPSLNFRQKQPGPHGACVGTPAFLLQSKDVHLVGLA